MNRPVDPPRLFDDASGAPALLRRALGDARADLPTAEAMARLAEKLGPILEPQPPPEGSPPGGGSPPPDGGSPALPPGEPPARTALPMEGGGAVGGGGIALGLAAAAVVLGVLWAGPDRPLSPDTLKPAIQRAAIEAHATEARSREALEAEARATEAQEGHLGDAASRALDAPRSSSSRARTSTHGPTPAAPVKGAMNGAVRETEANVLWRARSALSADPASALAAAAEHARLFPGGALAEEREVIAILALTKLGRAAEARARASELLRRRPDSVHRRRIEGALH